MHDTAIVRRILCDDLYEALNDSKTFPVAVGFCAYGMS